MKLRKQHQLYRHEPSNDIPGDCYRTSIACLLGLPAHKVPHFVLESWKGAGKTGDLTREWLRGLGWDIAEVIYMSDPKDVLEAVGNFNPKAVYLLSGKSPRGKWSHVVIARGNKIVWDCAAPDSFGWGSLDGACPEDDYTYVEFLVPYVEVE